MCLNELILEWNPASMPPCPSKPRGEPNFGCELTYLALARYQLVAHPANPSRMGKILCVVNGVEKIASHSLIISLFFNNNTYGIANFINRVIIPYNVATNFSINSLIFEKEKNK